jgi:hypothetical protein
LMTTPGTMSKGAEPELLQKQTEASDDKSESHEGQTGSNPSQKRWFRGQIVTRTTGGSVCHSFSVFHVAHALMRNAT